MKNELIRVENIRIKVKVGKKYQVRLKNLSEKNKSHFKYRPFEGILIQDTDDCLIFKGKNYSESFLKIDFAIRYYEIRESLDNGKWSKQLEINY